MIKSKGALIWFSYFYIVFQISHRYISHHCDWSSGAQGPSTCTEAWRSWQPSFTLCLFNVSGFIDLFSRRSEQYSQLWYILTPKCKQSHQALCPFLKVGLQGKSSYLSFWGEYPDVTQIVGISETLLRWQNLLWLHFYGTYLPFFGTHDICLPR